MNANLKLAGRFARATAVGVLATFGVAVVSDTVFNAHRAFPYIYSMADAPMLMIALLTMLLALVTISLLASGLLEAALGYMRSGPKAEPGASPNGGPATRLGNSGGSEGPPSVS
jgi:hypothetical protein